MFVLKTGTRLWSNNFGKRGPSRSWSRPSTVRERLPVPLLARHLARDRPARQQVHPDDRGLDSGAKVVDVRDRHDPHAAFAKRGELSGAAKRLEEIAVPRSVERRLTGFVAKQLPADLESHRDELVEDEGISEPALRHMRANHVVRREARHERYRNLPGDATLESACLRELDLEEAAPVDSGKGGLDDSPEPRRHPAREHDLRDLAPLESVDPGSVRVVVPGLTWLGEAGQILVARRIDRPSHDVGLR